MAMGEWLSVNSSREFYQKQIDIEKSELEHAPEEEVEEIVLIYEAKGLPRPQAEALAQQMMANKDNTALDTLVREELGIDPDSLGGSAWTAAASSSCCFSVGACFRSRRSCFSAAGRRSSPACWRAASPWRRSAPALAVYRPQRRLLGLPPAPDRLSGRRDHLRDRHAAGVTLGG